MSGVYTQDQGWQGAREVVQVASVCEKEYSSGWTGACWKEGSKGFKVVAAQYLPILIWFNGKNVVVHEYISGFATAASWSGISRTGIAQRQLEDDDPCVHEYISLKDLPTTASRSDISRTGIAPWLIVHGS